MALISRIRPVVGAAGWPRWRPISTRFSALLMAVAVFVGLALVVASTPIAARGDYGQWLMTARYYLGEEVPGYRNISALPPLVPLLLAAAQLVVRDPVVTLVAVNTVLLVGFGLSFYLLGATLLSSPIGGTLSVAIALLVTDRFLELFAFGGLLQSASVMFTCLAVAAFVQAGRRSIGERRWWVLGSACVALAALSHVGTGIISVPIGIAMAGLAVFQHRRLGWRLLGGALRPLLFVLLGLAAYWIVILLPASHDYVTNPASLAYRGPDRLFSGLFSYWPTTTLMVLGGSAVLLGSAAELARRRLGPSVVVGVWAGVVWGVLGYSILGGVATDYPRFATVLLPPLVVGAAAAMIWLAKALVANFRTLLPRSRPSSWLLVATAAVILVSAPFAVARHGRQSDTYQPHDAAALTAAVGWIDEMLGEEGGAVLTSVRDGKWLEGLTGRSALFSQPVRYAFRPTEWQRSVDADALLRSTLSLTNEYFFVKFIESVGRGATAAPTSLLVAANHGGEYVDLLQVAPAGTQIASAGRLTTLSAMTPRSVEHRSTETVVGVRTVWRGVGPSEGLFLSRRLELARNGSTLRIIDYSNGDRLRTDLQPVGGMAFTSVELDGRQARVCLTRIGASHPCLRIWVAQADAVIEQLEGSQLRVRTRHSPRLEIHVTVLTEASAPVSLGLLEPAALVAKHDVAAAILFEPDPASAARRARLVALGFREVRHFGPYAVMLRDAAPARGRGAER